MLGGQPDIVVVAEATNGEEALSATAASTPHVVLMDVRMPVMSGLAATHALHARPDPPAVLMLTTFDADDYVVEAVSAGANGFILKDTPPADIVTAVRRVARGEAVISPAATRSLLDQIRDSGADPDRTAVRHRALARLTPLTGREQEVAVCVGRGLSNAEIARALTLSVPTVKAHVSKVMDKLGTSNRVQVALLVHDAGLA